jgi:hypothetical protein
MKITVHTCPYKGFRHITVGTDTSYTARLHGKCWNIFKHDKLVGATPKVKRIELIIRAYLGLVIL